jgi:hypothetical protein
MQYFYIQTTEPAVYGSFDTKSEALRYANNAGFTCDWELVTTDPRDADVEHDGNSNHNHLD